MFFTEFVNKIGGNMKSRVNIHRVVGYGKRSVDNTTVPEKIEQLQRQIHDLEKTLEEPLRQIKELEATLQLRIRNERAYREKSCVLNGE
ncbi:hypothetical protein QUF80_19180 [Desulfococcaceae bacterium HSG8]|nr:hypothetical protein [Desulfococcaceae bacterium HSG8]